MISVPGSGDLNITVGQMAEGGTVSNTFGYDGTPYFAPMAAVWEYFFIDSLEIEWCPSNLVGISDNRNVGSDVARGLVMPFLITLQPDRYNQNSQSIS
jgi:hypothetical protein